MKLYREDGFVSKNIKDYIYLDQRLLNSTLAQYGEGLIINSIIGEETNESRSEEENSSTDYGFDGFFGFGAKAVNTLFEGHISELSNTQQNVIESAFDDYAVDMLIDILDKESKLGENISDAAEGDYFLIDTPFRIFDFEILENSTGNSILEIMKSGELVLLESQLSEYKQMNRNNKTPQSTALIKKFEKKVLKARNEAAQANATYININNFAKLGLSLFPDSIIVKVDDGVVYCDENKFRVNRSQLSVLNDSKRSIKVLGIISAIKDKVHPEGDFGEQEPNKINEIPTMLTDVLMSNFSIIDSNYRIIKPIAIYF